MDRILSHQFIPVRAVRIWRVAVTAPFRQEDVEMGRQRWQIWFKRPRVNPNPAWMEQNEGLTCALLVVPGTNSIQLNIVCHKDSFQTHLHRRCWRSLDRLLGFPHDKLDGLTSFLLSNVEY